MFVQFGTFLNVSLSLIQFPVCAVVNQIFPFLHCFWNLFIFRVTIKNRPDIDLQTNAALVLKVRSMRELWNLLCVIMVLFVLHGKGLCQYACLTQRSWSVPVRRRLWLRALLWEGDAVFTDLTWESAAGFRTLLLMSMLYAFGCFNYWARCII